MMKMAICATLAALLAGCSNDPNAKPEYGDSGLPKNCRAYIQVAVNDARAGKYTPAEAMEGIERNCGAAGHLW